MIAEGLLAFVRLRRRKGRTGIMSALILASLGINEELIMDDYRLSNDYFNIPAA